MAPAMENYRERAGAMDEKRGEDEAFTVKPKRNNCVESTHDNHDNFTIQNTMQHVMTRNSKVVSDLLINQYQRVNIS